MPQILVRLDETESDQVQQKATEFGLSKPAFIRQIIREYFRKPIQKEQPANNLKKEIRAIIPVLAQAIGRTQNLLVGQAKAIPDAVDKPSKLIYISNEDIEELSKFLLKKYDQEVQNGSTISKLSWLF